MRHILVNNPQTQGFVLYDGVNEPLEPSTFGLFGLVKHQRLSGYAQHRLTQG